MGCDVKKLETAAVNVKFLQRMKFRCYKACLLVNERILRKTIEINDFSSSSLLLLSNDDTHPCARSMTHFM